MGQQLKPVLLQVLDPRLMNHGSTKLLILLSLLLVAAWHLRWSPAARSDHRGIPLAVPLPRLPLLETGAHAYVTTLCSDEQARAAMVLVHSLRATKTPFPVIVLASNLSSLTQRAFEALGASLEPPPEIPAEHAPAFGEAPCSFLKIAAWSLTGFKKVIYLDHSQLMLANIDDIFRRPELTAVPDNFPPDRFNDGLMVLEPSMGTFNRMLAMFEELQPRLGAGLLDSVFFNRYFSNWLWLGSEHHLEYGFNAFSRLGYSATWGQWVHPNLKMLHFSGEFERWDDLVDKHYPGTRRYDHLRWQAYREADQVLQERGVRLPPQLRPPEEPMCHTDFMLYSQGGPLKRKISVALFSSGHPQLLRPALATFLSHRFVHKVYIIFPSEAARQKLEPLVGNISKPLEVMVRPSDDPNSRFLPIESMETDAVLLLDDTVEVTHAGTIAAVKAFLDEPHRLIGFFSAAHRLDEASGQLSYVAEPRGEYSMVLPRAVLMHADYLQSYTCTVPKAVHEYVKEMGACEDVAFNMVASRVSAGAPLVIVDPDKKDVGPRSLRSAHKLKRTKSECLNDLVALFGANPLRNTTEAKASLDRDTFTKREFREVWEEVAETSHGNEPLATVPIFDPGSTIAGTSDENLRFMPTLPRIMEGPEVYSFPDRRAGNPKVLCLQGNFSCSAVDCGNSYMLLDADKVPDYAYLQLGTTLLLHLRFGFADRYHTPNLLANVLHPMASAGPTVATNVLFFRRGSLVTDVGPWAGGAIQAVLGSKVKQLRLLERRRPVCFERAVVTRRYQPAPLERTVGLRHLQQRAFATCAKTGLSAGVAEEVRAWAAEQEDNKGSFQPGLVRILLLLPDRSGLGALENLGELQAAMQDLCPPAAACRFAAAAMEAPLTFCDEVLVLGLADIVLGVTGDSSISSVLLMRGGAKFHELRPFGVGGTDVRLVRALKDTAHWMRVGVQTWERVDGPECPNKECPKYANCRFYYRRRSYPVDVPMLVKALASDVELETRMLAE